MLAFAQPISATRHLAAAPASLVNQEERDYAAPSKPLLPKADTREKRQVRPRDRSEEQRLEDYRNGKAGSGARPFGTRREVFRGLLREGSLSRPLVARRRPAYHLQGRHMRPTEKARLPRHDGLDFCRSHPRELLVVWPQTTKGLPQRLLTDGHCAELAARLYVSAS